MLTMVADPRSTDYAVSAVDPDCTKRCYLCWLFLTLWSEPMVSQPFQSMK
uniref:Uncharacterized protein n=1 Tax=Anguilla anguilla TaxID=7936 RepID=A0A0E9WK38_ANGAN